MTCQSHSTRGYFNVQLDTKCVVGKEICAVENQILCSYFLPSCVNRREVSGKKLDTNMIVTAQSEHLWGGLFGWYLCSGKEQACWNLAWTIIIDMVIKCRSSIRPIGLLRRSPVCMKLERGKWVMWSKKTIRFCKKSHIGCRQKNLQ